MNPAVRYKVRRKKRKDLVREKAQKTKQSNNNNTETIILQVKNKTKTIPYKKYAY